MSTVRRYTAGGLADIASKLAQVQSFDPWLGKWISEAHMALRHAAETEARVMGLVDHLEKMIFFAELYDLKNSFDEEEIRLAREALSKFRGEDA